MYFAYVDETGIDGNSPCIVMVGILVDSQRLKRTQDEFGRIFEGLDGMATKSLKEVKSGDLLAGNGPWRGVPGEQRREVVSRLCGWLIERKHQVALAAIVHEPLKADPPAAEQLADPWLAAAGHIALQIQRVQQPKKNGKGRTVLASMTIACGCRSSSTSSHLPQSGPMTTTGDSEGRHAWIN